MVDNVEKGLGQRAGEDVASTWGQPRNIFEKFLGRSGAGNASVDRFTAGIGGLGSVRNVFANLSEGFATLWETIKTFAAAITSGNFSAYMRDYAGNLVDSNEELANDSDRRKNGGGQTHINGYDPNSSEFGNAGPATGNTYTYAEMATLGVGGIGAAGVVAGTSYAGIKTSQGVWGGLKNASSWAFNKVTGRAPIADNENMVKADTPELDAKAKARAEAEALFKKPDTASVETPNKVDVDHGRTRLGAKVGGGVIGALVDPAIEAGTTLYNGGSATEVLTDGAKALPGVNVAVEVAEGNYRDAFVKGVGSLGGIAGGIVGGGLGSVVPVFGTAVGGALVGTAGYYGFSGAAENVWDAGEYVWTKGVDAVNYFWGDEELTSNFGDAAPNSAQNQERNARMLRAMNNNHPAADNSNSPAIDKMLSGMDRLVAAGPAAAL